jgi:hypothetical protein
VIHVSDAAIDKALAPAAPRIQHAGAIQVIADTEDARWLQWKAKGRADDERFRRRVRTVLVDLAGVVILGAALWFAFS